MKNIILVVSLLLAPSLALGEVAKVTISNRATIASGQAFGASGAYEKLTGAIEFALDPKDPHNARVTDLDRAPRAADGRVHFTADVVVMRPTDQAKGNGVLLFEVVNRGRLGLLGRFNTAPASDSPTAAADFGNGYLMREGYTLVFIGWEHDVRSPLLRAEVPVIDGLVEPIAVPFRLDAKANDTALNDAMFYHPANPADPASTLTVRDRFWDRRTTIAREKWRFVAGAEGAPRIALDGGFEPGRWYEVTYKATGDRVVGSGLAAVRDAASAFRYRTDLPVRGTHAYAFGASQNGRFLREFLYDGFNADEKDRRVFDAVWAHIAGAARGNFNDRFGTPVDLSTFTATRLPLTIDEQKFNGAKVFFTNTDVEYWGGGRAAALIHTSDDGRKDMPIPGSERIYFLSDTQHGESAFPPKLTRGQQLENPVPQREIMRALLRGLDGWVRRGTAPPDSRYPKLADGTLTPVASVKFPAIPGVSDPRTIPGPGVTKDSRVTMLPYLVPQVDADGNDLAGIHAPDVSVPVATSTGWNFRSESVGGSNDIYSLMGSYIPFAATKAEREARKDPRPSLQERYRDRDDYLAKLRAAAQGLVKQHYLLEEDVENVMKRGQQQWEFVTARTATSSQ